MRQNLSNIAVFVLLASVITGVWWYVDQNFLPKPPEPLPPRETVQAVGGAVAGAFGPAEKWPTRTRVIPTPDPSAEPVEPVPVAVPAPAPKAGPRELIAFGGDDYNLNILLTTRGGGVQQLTLTEFDEANRLGREVVVTDADGNPVLGPDGKPVPQPLRLIPGVLRPRQPDSILIEAPFPKLAPGQVTDPETLKLLAEPSYQLLHYPSADDPIRQPDSATSLNGSYPSAELGQRDWVVAENSHPDGGEQRVVFETELAAPYFLKLRKVFTLSPGDYHFGLTIEVVPLPGRAKGKGKFRYQIAGAHGLPIEGEWYTSIYRNVQIGWTNPQGAMKRAIEDAGTIAKHYGGDKVVRSDNRFAYAAVTNQFFASALCLDDDVPAADRKNVWEYVRPTREPHPWDDPAQPFLSDVTFRAVSTELDVGPDATADTVTHQYLSYNGPLKVVQLGMLRGDKEIPEDLVTKYQDGMNLRTLTDYHSPTFFGRLANFLYWSDLVIFMTNIMHQVLYFLNGIVPVWGLNIIMLTVLVRLCLMAPSRRQQASVMRLQDKMARLKPEIEKLKEKHGEDFQTFNQEKTKLMLQNGVNPMATMGGCVLLFAQMPILMGLYFCLQESVFFRLQSFLWAPNLAAPDMLIWWTEKIPYISTPSSMGGFNYLGPYFNILPLLAVTLIFLHQKLTMPPPTDEQQEMQQKMMKIMVFGMALFFYKVAAGLCIYFICSTGWALAERKLIPKPKPPAEPVGGKPAIDGPPAKPGFMGRMMARVEEIKKQADEQSKRQIRNDRGPENGRGPDRNGGGKNKKRKKR